MADPATIISLLGMAATLIKEVLEYASAVIDAPKELERLVYELTKLHGVVTALAKSLGCGDNRAEYADSSPLSIATGVCHIPFHSARKATC